VENNLSNAEHHLARYLSLATWGLWGRRKREVKQELEGNIREMALEYQISGLTPHESLEQTLRAFGKPELVNAGMIRVYTMPILMRNTLLIAALGILSIGAMNSSTAQVITTNRRPYEPCRDTKIQDFLVGSNLWSCTGNRLYLPTQSLRTTLEPLGVKFELSKGVSDVNPTFHMTFPGGQETALHLEDLVKLSSNATDTEFEPIKTIPDFISLTNFFEALSTTGLPVTLEGWDKAQISVETISFILEMPETPLNKNLLFPIALYDKLDLFFLPRQFPASFARNEEDRNEGLGTESSQGQPSLHAYFRYEIRVKNAQSDSVYAVLSREKFYPECNCLNPSYRRADVGTFKDGVLEYVSSASKLEPTNSTTNLEKIERKGPGQVVVVRFTGRLDHGAKSFEIIPPDQISIKRTEY
jgi:hypothetical protein